MRYEVSSRLDIKPRALRLRGLGFRVLGGLGGFRVLGFGALRVYGISMLQRSLTGNQCLGGRSLPLLE